VFVPTWPSLFIDVKVGDNHEAMAAAKEHGDCMQLWACQQAGVLVIVMCSAVVVVARVPRTPEVANGRVLEARRVKWLVADPMAPGGHHKPRRIWRQGIVRKGKLEQIRRFRPRASRVMCGQIVRSLAR